MRGNAVEGDNKLLYVDEYGNWLLCVFLHLSVGRQRASKLES